jgi:hypothetical protein
MAKTNEQIHETHVRHWECKECHKIIEASETIAYHLVDGFLYGWCADCFDRSFKKAA